MQLFVCPDCRAVHDEPAEAAFVLEVRCFDCDLHVRHLEATRLVIAAMPEAA